LPFAYKNTTILSETLVVATTPVGPTEAFAIIKL